MEREEVLPDRRFLSLPNHSQRHVELVDQAIPVAPDRVGEGSLSVAGRHSPGLGSADDTLLPIDGWGPVFAGGRCHGESIGFGVVEDEVRQREDVRRPRAEVDPRESRGESPEVRRDGGAKRGPR